MTNSKPIDLHMRTYQERIVELELQIQESNARITTLEMENAQLNFDVKEAVEELAALIKASNKDRDHDAPQRYLNDFRSLADR